MPYIPKVTINITIDDLMNLGAWEAYCEVVGNRTINEELLDRSETLQIPWRVAQRMHLIERLQHTIG
jgi:hypothetical protein